MNKLQEKFKGIGLQRKAKLFMSSKLISLDKGCKIRSAIQTLHNHNVSGLPVTDDNGKLVGIATGNDLMMQAATKDLDEPIQYTEKIVTITEDTPLLEVIALFFSTKFRRLPVIDDQGYLRGTVSRLNVLNYLANNERNFDPEDLSEDDLKL